MKYTDWIYIGILAIIMASLFTFATVNLNASLYVWIPGLAIICVLYPIAQWLEKRRKKKIHSEKPEILKPLVEFCMNT